MINQNKLDSSRTRLFAVLFVLLLPVLTYYHCSTAGNIYGTLFREEMRGIIVDQVSLNLSEGESRDIGIKLDPRPAGEVTIQVTAVGNDLTFNGADSASLTFDTMNWNVSQTVTITAVDDIENEEEEAITVRASVSVGDGGEYTDSLSQAITVTIAASDPDPCLNATRIRDLSNFALSSLDSAASPDGFRIIGDNINDQAGTSISFGDIDNDGRNDILLGANESTNSADEGKGHVILSPDLLGSNITLSNTNNFVIEGNDSEARDNQLGNSIASGDINGDNMDDVLIGSGTPSASGFAYVIFGGGSTADIIGNGIGSLAPRGFRIEGQAGNDQLGTSIASGDINNNNFDDVIVGTARAGGTGKVYIVWGGSSPANITGTGVNMLQTSGQGFEIAGNNNSDQVGDSVASGDINGDGIDDVLIGATGVDISGEQNVGAAYVVFGSGSLTNINLTTPLNNTALGFSVTGADATDVVGASIASGDINNDGTDDVLIGARGVDANSINNRGAVYVVFGGSGLADISSAQINSLSTAGRGFRILGTAAGNSIGSSVSSGDINGDGVQDVIIGAQIVNSNAGAVYVVFGKSSGLTDIDLGSLSSDKGLAIQGSFNSRSGSSVSSTDINGDMYDDLLIGAETAAGFDRGAAYIVYGACQR